MRMKGLTALLLGTCLVGGAAQALAEDATLTIESWRNEDLAIWQDKIIPAFNAKYPDIKVVFSPAGSGQYDAALNSKLAGGTAGDLITCRPFDTSLNLYKQGNLADITTLPGMENFSDVAKSAWSTDDGKTTFCVPMASVIHGFIYNKDAFAKLGITPPTTEAEFFAVLDKIKADGTYIPLAFGTKDQWETAAMGYQNIGPAYWHGEDGRKALIAGKEKLTDAPWVEPYRVLAKWKPYLGDGFEAQSYSDSQNLFTLGRAAIYPAGSWEIAGFNANAKFAMGAFPPPVPKAGDSCYISDHNDIGMGLNAKSKNPEAAKTFLSWVASPEFAQIYADALPGFFSLSSASVVLKDPLAAEFQSWRGKCKSTIRASTRSCRAARRISRTTPTSPVRTSSTAPSRRKMRSRICRPVSIVGTSRRNNSDERRRLLSRAPPLFFASMPGAWCTTREARERVWATATRAKSATRWHIVVFLAPAVAVYTALLVLPLVGTLYQSLFREIDHVRLFVGLSNFVALLTDPRLSASFWNALAITSWFFVIHMLVQNPIGILLAALLTTPALRFRGFYRTAISCRRCSPSSSSASSGSCCSRRFGASRRASSISFT